MSRSGNAAGEGRLKSRDKDDNGRYNSYIFKGYGMSDTRRCLRWIFLKRNN